MYAIIYWAKGVVVINSFLAETKWFGGEEYFSSYESLSLVYIFVKK